MPPSPNSIPGQLSNLIDRFSAMRTGVVTSVNPVFVVVDVAGTAFNAAYIRAAVPKEGDTVAILRQGATWFVLGTTSASGENLVQNPSFEEADAGTGFPTGWTLYNVAGVSTYESVPSEDAIDGNRVLEVLPVTGVGVQSFVYSQPVSVTAGDVLELSAYAGGFYPTSAAPDTADAALVALWFADANDLYPTTSSANIVVATELNIVEYPPWTNLQGTVTAPVTGFMRMAVRTTADAVAGGLHWDLAVARLQTP